MRLISNSSLGVFCCMNEKHFFLNEQASIDGLLGLKAMVGVQEPSLSISTTSRSQLCSPISGNHTRRAWYSNESDTTFVRANIRKEESPVNDQQSEATRMPRSTYLT